MSGSRKRKAKHAPATTTDPSLREKICHVCGLACVEAWYSAHEQSNGHAFAIDAMRWASEGRVPISKLERDMLFAEREPREETKWVSGDCDKNGKFFYKFQPIYTVSIDDAEDVVAETLEPFRQYQTQNPYATSPRALARRVNYSLRVQERVRSGEARCVAIEQVKQQLGPRVPSWWKSVYPNSSAPREPVVATRDDGSVLGKFRTINEAINAIKVDGLSRDGLIFWDSIAPKE